MAAPMQNLYDRQREQASQRVTAGAQQGKDALTRRFASLGGLNSGAAIKSQQQADESANQQREQAIGNIDATQAQDEANRTMRQEETQQAQSFQSGEAAKERAFTKAHNDTDRAFQEKVFSADQSSKLRALDQADKAFAAGRGDAEFQKRLERYKAGQSGGLFGGGGFLGLGIGAGPADV